MFKRHWEILESSLPRPTRLRTLIKRDYAGFKERVLRGDEAFAKAICASLYAGDCYILSGAFTQDFMQEMKLKTSDYFKSKPSEFHKMLEGCPDFHRAIDLETGKKYSFPLCKHSAYFFPWNGDPLNIIPEIYDKWRVVKTLMGLDSDAYEKNTPKDGIVDRFQVVQYPNRIGYLEPHSDPYLYQRLFISGYMSKRGLDYHGGGFYLVANGDEVRFAEDEIEIGDLGIGYATVYHGVAPCNRDLEPEWNADSGRWFLGLYSNASDEVPNRHTGHPVKLNLPGVSP